MAKQNKKLAEVFHYDLYGKRQDKYDFLNSKNIGSIEWTALGNIAPYYFFIPKDFKLEKKYTESFKIDTLFNGVSGIETKRDHFAIDFDLNNLKSRISRFVNNDYDSEKRKDIFKLRDNEWIVDKAVDILRTQKQWTESFYPCLHRPFDYRWIIYSNVILSRDRGNLMRGLNYENNLGLVAARQTKENFDILVSNAVCTHKIVTVYDRSFIFPLYIYPEQKDEIFTEKDTSTSSAPNRKPNLNPEIVSQIAKKIGLEFVSEKPFDSAQGSEGPLSVAEGPLSVAEMAPIDILDYIYAVLHSPTYREKYKEFLKIDFPRVPYPKDKDTFWKLVKLGGEIRQIHLLESPKVEDYITSYPVDGDNTITTKISKKDWEITDEENQLGRIWINESQYFDNIPLIAWEFYIGGYQPAQKWLKDRKGRTLSFEDILHYQKIIVALFETDRLMKEIDLIGVE